MKDPTLTVSAREQVYELRMSLPPRAWNASHAPTRMPCRGSPHPPGWSPQGDSHRLGLGARAWDRAGELVLLLSSETRLIQHILYILVQV